MKTFLVSLLFIFLGSSINAQVLERNQVNPPSTKVNPIFIINNTVIGNATILKKIPVENLLISDFSKDAQLNTERLYIKLEKRGIWKVETDYKFDVKIQKDLNTFFGLKEDNDIYVNGYLIHKKHSISTESIQKIELLKAYNTLNTIETSSSNVIILNIII